MPGVNLIIVDDHPLLRKGLIDILHDVAGTEVVGEAENGAMALDLINKLSPDIAIVDIDMPVMDGIELVRALRRHRVDTKIIFLTIHKDRSLLKSLVSLGVLGYVLKDSATDEIVACVRAVAAGDRFVSPTLAALSAKAVDDNSSTIVLDSLTPTELRVLQLIAASRTSREIASELRISVRTVETHRYNICYKLDIKGTHALLKLAVQNKSQIQNANTLRETT